LPQPAHEDETEEVPGAGIIVRSEVIQLRIPAVFRELARIQFQDQILRGHNDLRSFLERRRLQDLCYSLTTRGHQVNGGHSDITFVRHPYAEPHHFQEVLDILARTIGRTDRDTTADFSTASVGETQ